MKQHDKTNKINNITKNTNKRARPFNDPLSGTTGVSWY